MSTGIVIGIVCFLLRTAGMLGGSATWISRNVSAFAPRTVVKFESRVRRALSSQGWLYSLRIFLPLPLLLVGGILLLLWGGIAAQMPFVVALIGTYSIAALLGLLLGLFKSYRIKIVTHCAREAAYRLSPAIANDILVSFAKSATVDFRFAALQALRALGTAEAMEELRGLGAMDQSSHGAQARRDFLELKQSWDGELAPQPVEGMDTLVEEYHQLENGLPWRSIWPGRYASRMRMADILWTMDKVVGSQLPLRRAFPHVYCRACNARAQRLVHEGRDWVRCRKCKTVGGLQTGIIDVVGHIGSNGPWGLHAGTLTLQLWDEDARTGVGADLDELHVMGGQGIHYDWAVGAVVECLQQHSSQLHPEVPVKLVGEPVLESNSLSLLRALDGNLGILR